uniref:Peptidase S1 domain-containing protein n=1 Tax=Pinctada fucata TaxID=50426 RepID=A0A194AK31_PINFU
MASLLYRGSHTCGGVLINSQSILTAAHCVSGRMFTNRWNVKLGAHDRFNSATGEQVFGVSSIKHHPSYNSNTFENDVAIIRLDKEVQESQSILPVCVATALPNAGTNCTTTGWGTLSSGGSLSTVLMQVNVPLVDHNTCNNYYQSYGGIDESTMVCAGYESGGKDSCQGDSGGPLVCKNSEAQWDVVGITSWGVGCAWEKYPGVYAKVSTFYSWIQQNA